MISDLGPFEFAYFVCVCVGVCARMELLSATVSVNFFMLAFILINLLANF